MNVRVTLFLTSAAPPSSPVSDDEFLLLDRWMPPATQEFNERSDLIFFLLSFLRASFFQKGGRKNNYLISRVDPSRKHVRSFLAPWKKAAPPGKRLWLGILLMIRGNKSLLYMRFGCLRGISASKEWRQVCWKVQQIHLSTSISFLFSSLLLSCQPPRIPYKRSYHAQGLMNA